MWWKDAVLSGNSGTDLTFGEHLVQPPDLLSLYISKLSFPSLPFLLRVWGDFEVEGSQRR